jgi:hypothetical protein
MSCVHKHDECRSYGVLLWEILTFGELPLADLKTSDIIDLAESHELLHPRYNKFNNFPIK